MMIFQNVLFFYKIELDVFNSYSGFDPIVPTKNFSISRSPIHTVPCKPKRRPIILMSHPNIHPKLLQRPNNRQSPLHSRNQAWVPRLVLPIRNPFSILNDKPHSLGLEGGIFIPRSPYQKCPAMLIYIVKHRVCLKNTQIPSLRGVGSCCATLTIYPRDINTWLLEN